MVAVLIQIIMLIDLRDTHYSHNIEKTILKVISPDAKHTQHSLSHPTDGKTPIALYHQNKRAREFLTSSC